MLNDKCGIIQIMDKDGRAIRFKKVLITLPDTVKKNREVWFNGK